MLPMAEYGTGQPWAFTQKVDAMPKSLLDCIAFGPNPMASICFNALFQRSPDEQRKVLLAVSGSKNLVSSVMA